MGCRKYECLNANLHSQLSMYHREYTDADEAFRLMNAWTQIQTSYQTQFTGKTVTKVDITFEGEMPRGPACERNPPVSASVYYTNGTGIGIDRIDLREKQLLPMPKNTLDFMVGVR